MDDILYEVRITALQEGTIPSEQIHATFADLFCLAPAEASQRLSSLPCRVRGNLSLEQAGKYQRVLRRAGMLCEIVPQSQAQPQPQPKAPVPPWSPLPSNAAPAGGQP